MMKKWLAVMLLLCMLIPCAQAAGKLSNTEICGVRQIDNNTAETIWEPCFFMVLRDEAGKIFSMKDMKAYGVGIPAGATVYYRADVDYDAEMYIKEGHTSTAECVVYLKTY